MLKLQAQSQNITLSDLIRKIIDRELNEDEMYDRSSRTRDALLRIADIGAEYVNEDTPNDLATNLDTYLYGDEEK